MHNRGAFLSQLERSTFPALLLFRVFLKLPRMRGIERAQYARGSRYITLQIWNFLVLILAQSKIHVGQSAKRREVVVFGRLLIA